MTQSALAKHLGISSAALSSRCRTLRLQEGREFRWENRGKPGLERKNFTPSGIRLLEVKYEIPPERRHRPPDALEAHWHFFKAPPNPTLIYIKHRDTGETARMRVTPAFRDRFKPNTRIPDDRLQETTKPKSPEREFAHNAKYPKPFSGKYGQPLWDGEMV